MAEFVLTPQIKALALRTPQDLLRPQTVFIVSAETNKPIRVNPNNTVSANGGLGAHAQFQVHRAAHGGPFVRFQNAGTGKFLAIKAGNLTVGAGGEHCEFIVQHAQLAVILKKHRNPNAKIGFNANGQPVPANKLGNGSRARFFIFDSASVVRPAQPAVAVAQANAQAARAQAQAAQAQARAAQAQAQARAAQAHAQAQARAAQAHAQAQARAAHAHAAQAPQAEFILTPAVKAMALRSMGELRGEMVFIVNAETSKPICVAGGRVHGLGNLGPSSRFRVRRGDRPHRLGPVVRFQNAQTGQYLAIKGGQLTLGAGGEHCEFIVEMAQMAVFLKKHNNPGARIGFNANGQPVPANNLGNGNRGRFFIFDCDMVTPQPVPIPAAHAVPAQAVPVPAQRVLRPGPIQPGRAGILKISDRDLCLVPQHGPHTDPSPLILHGGIQHAAHRKEYQVIFKPTVFPNTFVIQCVASGLCFHAYGGSKDGSDIALHGNEQYARQHGNSKFQVIGAGGNTFILKAQDSAQCMHAYGGSKDGHNIKMHGDQGYNSQHGNGKFHFIPL